MCVGVISYLSMPFKHSQSVHLIVLKFVLVTNYQADVDAYMKSVGFKKVMWQVQLNKYPNPNYPASIYLAVQWL